MRIIVTLFICLLCTIAIYSQEDPAAIKVLEQFSSRAKGAPSVSISFTVLTVDAIENRKDTLEGNVVIKGDKYRLTLPESTVWFNGTDSWNYIPEVNEVTISKPEPGENSFFAKPSLLYTMYLEGYKPKLIEERDSEFVIDLYPTDIKIDLVRIRLTITKSGMKLKTAEYKTKRGITMTLKVSNYDLAFKPAESYFVFDPSKYKGIEVIDMR